LFSFVGDLDLAHELPPSLHSPGEVAGMPFPLEACWENWRLTANGAHLLGM
jgi:hypothetical protein